MQLDNKVVFPTGSASGIGRECALACAREGASVVVAVSLMARKFGLPVVPHVGDMGQIHRHLLLFNHIAMGHEAIFLEHIHHLSNYLVHPASIERGVYKTPEAPGLSCDLKAE